MYSSCPLLFLSKRSHHMAVTDMSKVHMSTLIDCSIHAQHGVETWLHSSSCRHKGVSGQRCRTIPQRCGTLLLLSRQNGIGGELAAFIGYSPNSCDGCAFASKVSTAAVTSATGLVRLSDVDVCCPSKPKHGEVLGS